MIGLYYLFYRYICIVFLLCGCFME